MTNHAVPNRTDLRERTKTMSRHGDRPGQIADFRGSFETINWLYLLFKCGIKTKKHFEWVLWHWSSLGQLNLEPTRPNGLVGCKVPTYTYLPNCRFWPTAYGDTIGATTGVNISDIVSVVDPSAWSRAYAIHWLYCLYWLLCTWVYPGIRGWSGTEHKYWSSIALNLSTEILVWFLRWMGRRLNSWSPLMPNEARRMLWIRGGADGRTFGTWQILPRRGCHFEEILVGHPRCWGHCLLRCAMYIVRHTFRASFRENIGWETVVVSSRKDAACL